MKAAIALTKNENPDTLRPHSDTLTPQNHPSRQVSTSTGTGSARLP
jgi:hypothetical protein